MKAEPDARRVLAEKIVKVIRQNPALASNAEYDRIVELIQEYIERIKEQH